jgi:lysophospholipase L1-like esterase
VDARYVRVYGIERGTPYGFSLWEIEVYGLPPGGGTLQFIDRFSDGDNFGWAIVDNATFNAPSNWAVVDNIYRENSGEAYYDGAGIHGQTSDGFEIGTYSLLTSDGFTSPFGPLDLRLELRSEGIGIIGAMFGFQDDDNYYRFSLSKREGYRKLEKKVGGIFKEISTSTQSYTPNDWMSLRIIHQNGVIIIYLDGEKIAAANDNTFSGGRIALWTGRNTASEFDDIIVFDAPSEPIIGLVSPVEYFVGSSGLVIAEAVTNGVGSIGGVEFVADEGTGSEIVAPGILVTPSDPSLSPYYSAQFDFISPGEHEIKAYLLNSGIERLTAIEAVDIADFIGVNGINLSAFGDSITTGDPGDDWPFDDISADTRNTSGGYEPVLNDEISSVYPDKPVSVIDEGTSGDRIWEGAAKVATIVSRNPEAQALLVMFGTNDALRSIPTDPDDFKEQLSIICDTAILGGKKVFIATPPPIDGTGTWATTRNQRLSEFSNKIDELIFEYGQSSPGQVFAGPNFFDDPDATPIQISPDKIHPTGQGFIEMGVQWGNVINQKISEGVL